MARRTLYQITQEARANNANATLSAGVVDAKKLRFQSVVAYLDKNNVNQNHVICTPKGAVKTYSDMDSLIKDYSATFPSISTGTILIDVSPLVKPTPPNYDADRANAAELSKTQRMVLSQAKIVADLDDELVKIAAFETGTPSQIALFNERTEQRATAYATKLAMDARITELLALV